MNWSTFIIGLASLGVATGAHAEPWRFTIQPFAPYVLNSQGKAEGPLPEVVELVCQRMRITCLIEVLPWRRGLLMAREGSVHGVIGLQKNPEREKMFFLGSFVIKGCYSVYVQKKNPIVFEKPKDLSGYTVVAYGPSATLKAAESLTQSANDAKLLTEISNNVALRKLSAGRYHENSAVVINRDVGEFLVKKEKMGNIRKAGDLQKITYYIGLVRNAVSTQDAKRFDSALVELSAEGKLAAIYNRSGLQPAQCTKGEKGGDRTK